MLLLLILMFGIHSCVVCDESCTPEDVSGAEGGEAVLRVHHTGIRIIYWVLLSERTNIIATKPGRSIDDDDVILQYRGRVISDDDGSLQIYNLSSRDQRIYKADIQTSDDKTSCASFNLTVYERLSDGDIKISHSLTRNGSCSLRLFCTVDKRDVTITWSHGRGSQINVTQGALYVPPSDVNITYICTAHNPVSNASKSVVPGSYCNTGTRSLHSKSKSPWILGIAFTACVMIILLVIYKRMQKGKIKKNEISTTYAQVEQRTQEGNLYHEHEKEQQSLTLYSEVQHAKKTNSQKKVMEQKPNSIETVYSTVQFAKENQQNGAVSPSAGPSNCSNAADKA